MGIGKQQYSKHETFFRSIDFLQVGKSAAVDIKKTVTKLAHESLPHQLAGWHIL